MPLPRQAAIAGAIDSLLLTPEETVLAGMWIETGNGDARLRHAEARQFARRQVDVASSDGCVSACGTSASAI